MSAAHLFPERLSLHFHSDKWCACGTATTIRKTSRKTVATVNAGEFEAIETQTFCKPCQQTFGSDELRSLTPPRGKFGFDVIEYIGKSLFVQCRNEREIQAELATRNITISAREIGFLSKRFIVYLALAHHECQAELKHYMHSKGGYILHMDGTCEGDSPHLFSCLDEISNIVLGNRKMPSEDSQYIGPLLHRLKAAYGVPLALVHDMGSAILKAVLAVFPGVPDYICHFHFLRDLGKDLFDFEYRTIRRYTQSYGVRAKLNHAAKQLKAAVNNDQLLQDSLDRYLKNNQTGTAQDTLDPKVAGSRVALLQPRPPRTARETFASSSSRLSNVGCPTRLGGCQYRPFSQAFTIRAWSRRTLWCTDGPLMAAQFTASREAAPAAIAAVICFASGAG